VRFATEAYLLLGAYVIASLLYMVVVSQLQSLPRWLAFTAHAFDVIWLAVLTSITGASSSPLFPFFTFIVLAAAFRWGYRETLGTTFLVIWVILIETTFLIIRGSLEVRSLFELNQFLVRITYMAITGVLLAYLASHQKKLQLESSLVARILSRVRSETTLDSALESTGHELLRGFGARAIAIAVRETRGGQAALWTLNDGGPRDEPSAARACGCRPLPVEGASHVRAQAAPVQDGHHGGEERQRRRMATTVAPAQTFGTALVLCGVRRALVGRVFPLRSRAARQQRRTGWDCSHASVDSRAALHSCLPHQTAAIAIRGVRARAAGARAARHVRQSLIGSRWRCWR
jgi:hypothetical protein